LVAAHAWGDLSESESWLVRVAGMTFEDIEAVGHQILAEQLAPWQDKYPGVSVEPRVIHRQLPAAALIELGPQARIIVVGSHGRGGFTRLFLGSVSHAVAQHATCPVVVCRRPRAAGTRGV
jgi:nucleotide-binding universal stress UspA family protein